MLFLSTAPKGHPQAGKKWLVSRKMTARQVWLFFALLGLEPKYRSGHWYAVVTN